MKKEAFHSIDPRRMTKMQTALSLLFLFVIASALRCAALSIEHESSYYSNILKRKADYVVVLPSDFQVKKAAGHRYPVLYLLHCAGCDCRSFIQDYHLLDFIDSVDLIVALPDDGTSGGWWLDSPINSLSHLSTWVSKEFKNHIDSIYPTLTNRENTGVAGHSMGGFGAMHNLLSHPGVYGAAFSSKGLFDMVGHKGAYMATRVLGPFAANQQSYHAVDILKNAARFAGINAAIRFYSGPNDWFQEENRAFDSLLSKHNVPHSYFENDEGHYPMSSKSMRDMLFWFDSVFTHDSNKTAISRTGAALMQPESKIRYFNSWGNPFFYKNDETFFHINGTAADKRYGKIVSSGMFIGMFKRPFDR